MTDVSKDLSELRHEIVEARNQAIKTDNQVKNLALDVKGFDKRFVHLERRTRLASLGVHILVAIAIVTASYVVHGVRMRAVTQDLDQSVAEAERAKKLAEEATAGARAKELKLEQERTRREKVAATALEVVELLDKGREKDAIDILNKVDSTKLSPLEAKLFDRQMNELRTRAAETGYKAGRQAQVTNQHAAAIAEYRRVLSLQPDGRFASPVRYYLGTALWNLRRHEEAEPVLREILEKEKDKAMLEEVRYLLASSLQSLGRADEAKVAFAEIVQKGGRYTTSAKEQLKVLDKTP